MRATKRAFAASLSVVLLASSALAQSASPAITPPPPPPSVGPTPTSVAVEVRTPPLPAYRRLSDGETQAFRDALRLARLGAVDQALSQVSSVSNPLARRIVLWAAVDAAGDRLPFVQLDAARRDLWGWPRQSNRQGRAERALERSGLSPSAVIAWFGGEQPTTAEGAIALASAYQQTGRGPEATTLVRAWWRDRLFEAAPQDAMLSRFGGLLLSEDHVKRADLLLYGPQGPAARTVVNLLPADYRTLADVRMRLRAGTITPDAATQAVPADLRNHAGLAFEQARYYRSRDMPSLAFPLLSRLPSAPGHDDGDDRIWEERRRLMNAAIQANNWRVAYQAVANAELQQGADYAEAEFFAGWLALTKLRDVPAAERHFQRVRSVARTPVTNGRAWYWLGRVAEARGDEAEARRRYGEGARWWTSFFGQLAAEKVGTAEIVLPPDPQPTEADRARFDGRELVQAVRLLFDSGERELARSFALHLDDTLPTAEEAALLVDLVRGSGDQFGSMLVVRAVAQRGFIMPVRGYPMRTPPAVAGAPETAYVLGLTRQESGFDAGVGSGVGARGMMQLMPATAALVARQLGVSYSPGMLTDADYNMRLGQTYLRDTLDRFNGSYVMAAAGYNAGPGRPAQWSRFCGDPRQGVDPIDFIECIPFTETRDYVMRVMEATQIYRARLNGGRAPIRLTADLRRGSLGGFSETAVAPNGENTVFGPRPPATGTPDRPWNPSPSAQPPITSRPVPNPPEAAAPVSSTPVPNPTN